MTRIPNINRIDDQRKAAEEAGKRFAAEEAKNNEAFMNAAKRAPGKRVAPTNPIHEGEPKVKSESRFEMKLPAQLKEQAQNRADELGISLAEYVKSLLKQDILRNSGGEMTFAEAVEIYSEYVQEELDESGLSGQVIQPGVDSSYLKGGIWYLRNINGHLARVGTKCGCVLPNVSRNPT
ncbi:hypothetical protein RCF98_02535 [Thiothrix lacustris]|uniref:Ribbon-helix-helix protein CopG domain-containing protein n=1 Tax=Thiothrix lacustris TaxID=525917 RepID=A0ABY9MRG5_9GAMM|nr:hypothetical protein [Thiothrix lacustris]WML91240.1 hypothetical protein RCF98_02535 [Thiothrix lacustris]